mmetsp:Transcript_27446/g.23058  ORF Transcript_27446/g.23058 Transcript_27446/m.23058 type:complete len:298 (+) Transcript_27446:1-894(+)
MGKIARVLVICAHLLSVSAFIPAPSLLAQRTIRVVQPSGLSSVYCLSEERRKALLQFGILATLTAAQPATAFDNAIAEYSKFAKKPKRRGDAPKDLGVAPRSINKNSLNADPKNFAGLRGCDGKTNCFSTTGDDLMEDRIQTGQDTLIKTWVPPADDAAPWASLVAEVKAYTPGQGFIDGGGFKVSKETESYIYVQFEALKKGYIDDVEFALSKDSSVQVRSSSRVGATDFGVNAKRLNYIAAGLRKKGWRIEDITEKTHPDYFYAATDAADQTFDQDRRKGSELQNARLERPSMGL